MRINEKLDVDNVLDAIIAFKTFINILETLMKILAVILYLLFLQMQVVNNIHVFYKMSMRNQQLNEDYNYYCQVIFLLIRSNRNYAQLLVESIARLPKPFISLANKLISNKLDVRSMCIVVNQFKKYLIVMWHSVI